MEIPISLNTMEFFQALWKQAGRGKAETLSLAWERDARERRGDVHHHWESTSGGDGNDPQVRKARRASYVLLHITDFTKSSFLVVRRAVSVKCRQIAHHSQGTKSRKVNLHYEAKLICCLRCVLLNFSVSLGANGIEMCYLHILF